MLPNLPTYEKIFENFTWQIEHKFNMGSAVCEKFAKNEPERIALIGWRNSGLMTHVTYGELHESSNRLANGLEKLGITAGERIAIILPQSPQTVLAHIAIYKIAAITVPLARLFAPDALAYRLKHSGAKCVITNQTGLEKINQVKDQLPELKVIIGVDCEDSDEGHHDFNEVISDSSPDYSAVETTSDTPALIIYTSGTTGPPKGALHAHRVLLGHIPGLQVHHEFIPRPKDIAWTPADWAWAGGLLNILLPCLYLGVPVVYGGMDRFDPESAFQLMSETKTTCAFIPPTALRLLQNIENPAKKFPLEIRTIGSGGESVGKGPCEWFKRELGIEINEFYGQTECNLVLSGFGARRVSRHGSIGKPVPGHQVALLDAEREFCEIGEPGEVAIKRPDPIMFLEYWNDPQATQDKFHGDWMLTGDQCVQDEDGYFHFVGRDDDIISSAGYRLGPGEIEDCLMSHPAIDLAAAVGKPDKLRGEIIKAYVVLAPSRTSKQSDRELIREIQLHVKHRLAENIYPREIEFVDSIPLTTTGKVIRRLFRQKALEETQS